MFSYAYSIVGMDSLFMNIMNCIAGNVTIIQGAFKTIRERALPGQSKNVLRESKADMKVLRAELRKIVNHLQTIFKYAYFMAIQNFQSVNLLKNPVQKLYQTNLW